MQIKIKNISKTYEIDNTIVEAVKNVNADFEAGKISAIVGKSGCGKTTLLKLIAGLERLSGGFIDIGAAKTGMVFQEHRLLPWLNIKQNLKLPSNKISELQACDMLKFLGLWNCRNAYPHQISGGMAQRAALGRVLLYNPDIVLLDEPFSFLDYFTRKNFQKDIVEIQRKFQKTMIIVTHDLDEALFLADLIYIMKEGSFVSRISLRNADSETKDKYKEQILDLI
jgi:sulfonate transport system ATP-binding protein